ncbi:arginase family protein [Nonomuraea sp. NPDC003804]|uniref:arginase family protein n=1 Tax=Nonomuraea sp. NPDC003804 TaxID=3154547 RepID=UPI0033A38D44
MARPERPVIIQVRTNLGLVPGVERLGGALLDAGLAEALGARRGPVVEAPPYSWERIHPSRLLNAEAIADVALRQAGVVADVLDAGAFPIMLGGDDSVIFGSLLALGRTGSHGLVFLDAHTDFYPPEHSPTGEASDSELYLAFGPGADLLPRMDGAPPLVRSRAAALIGHRDPDEQRDTGAALRATDALVVSLARTRDLGAEETARQALAHLDGAGVERFLLHVDADVLDDALMPAVDYRLPGGLTRREFAVLAGTLLADPRAAALDVTIYNPALDPDGSAARDLTACLLDAFTHATTLTGRA